MSKQQEYPNGIYLTYKGATTMTPINDLLAKQIIKYLRQSKFNNKITKEQIRPDELNITPIT